VNAALEPVSSPAPATGPRHDPALHIDGVSMSFSGKTVLHPFELVIRPGRIHALLGQNGSGKSTLIKILSGYHQPDTEGTCLVGGHQLTYGSGDAAQELGLRFVHQDLGLIATSSILDNLSFARGFPTRLGTIRDAVVAKECRQALRAVGLPDLDPHALVATLTPAQRTGVAIARALEGAEDTAAVLVLDEPTATLPDEEVQHLHSMLRAAASNGLGILYVTHFLDEVYQMADQVSVLRDGRLVVTADVADIDRRQLVHHLIGGELESVMRESRAHSIATDEVQLTVSNLHAGFIRGVSFSAHVGEIVGVYGLTGSGRESLLACIFGAIPRADGVVRIADKEVSPRLDRAIASGMAYLPPDRKISGGIMHLDAMENLTLSNLKPFWKRGWLSSSAATAETQSWFKKLQVRPAEGARSSLSSFSGGNQQKIIFGKWLRLNPRVLLLDDPTQGVDVGAKAELHRQIIAASEAGSTVIVSSTDVEELATLCDRVLVLRDGRVVEELSGGDVTEKRINSSSHGAVAATTEGS
jgi:ribose transport system ATP-binding protein